MALPEDAGHYTMLAVNSVGKTTCSSQLYIDRVGNIDATSFVAPETLDRILGRYDVCWGELNESSYAAIRVFFCQWVGFHPSGACTAGIIVETKETYINVDSISEQINLFKRQSGVCECVCVCVCKLHKLLVYLLCNFCIFRNCSLSFKI